MSSAPDSAAVAAGAEWVIEPRQHGVWYRAREFWAYRRLWWYFAADTLTSLYRRSPLGWLWMLMRVAGPIGLSAVIFGGVLQVSSGTVPYFLFFLCGTTTWMLFERSLLVITRSLEQNRRLITKIYFPRLILPTAAVSIAALYLTLLLVVIVGTSMYFFRRDGVWYISLRPELLVAVGAVLLSLIFAVAVGLWTSVLQARYRDVRYGIRYFLPFWFYLTPVIYPLSRILDRVPDQWHWVVSLNPMVTVVEAFKWGTLGEGTLQPASVVTSLALIAVTLASGLWFFIREEAASIDKL